MPTQKQLTLVFITILLILSHCSKDTESSKAIDERLFPIKENSKWGFMDSSGKVVVAPTFDYAWDFSQGLGRFKQNGKYGFVNEKGEVVIQPTLTYADDFSGDYTRVNVKDTVIYEILFDGYGLYGDWAYINKEGIIYEQKFEVAEPVKNNYGMVKDVNNYETPYSYVSFEGNTLNRSERITKAIFNFNGHSLAPASDPTTGKIGLIDEHEQWVVFPAFDQIEALSEGLAAAKKDNVYGYIDVKGSWVYQQVVSADDYFYLSNDFKPFTNGLAAVRFTKDTYGYINKNGKPAFKQKFKSVTSFTNEGYAIVSTETGTSLIDKDGNLVIKPHLDIQDIAQGVVVFRTPDGYGAKEIKTQKEIVAPKYTNVAISGKLIKLTESGATNGYIDATGKFVIAPQFNTAWEFKNGKAIVSLKDKYVYIDKNGKVLGNVPENEQPYYSNNSTLYAWSDETGKYGYSKSGVDGLAIPANYDFATDFEKNIARVNVGATINEESYGYNGGKWGLINEKGETILAPTYELILPFTNGAALYNAGGIAEYYICEEECDEPVYYNCQGGKWGLLDEQGKILIDAKYDQLIPFGTNFLARTGDNFSLISASGNTITQNPLSFEFVQDGSIIKNYNSKFLKASENGKMGIIDNNGKWIIDPAYEDIIMANSTEDTPFIEGVVLVKSNGVWGAANTQGQLSIQPAFEEMRSFSSELAAVKQEGKWGFVNVQGDMIINPSFYEVRDFQNNAAIVTADENSGERVIDKTGKVIFTGSPTLKFDYDGFINGLAVIRSIDGDAEMEAAEASTSVITSTGKVLFPQNSLADARIQPDGLLYVKKNNKWALSNASGAMLTGFEFDWIEPYTGQALIKFNVGGELSYGDFNREEYFYGGLWGLLDKSGKVVVKPMFREIGVFSEGLASATSGEDLDKVGYVDLSGNVIREMKK